MRSCYSAGEEEINFVPSKALQHQVQVLVQAPGGNYAETSSSETVVGELILESDRRSVQDTEDIGNGEPWKSEEVNAAGSEGVGDEDVGSELESHGSGVARCECEPSVTREEIRDGVASGFFKVDLEMGAEEPTRNESKGSDSVKETLVEETEDEGGQGVRVGSLAEDTLGGGECQSELVESLQGTDEQEETVERDGSRAVARFSLNV